MGWATHAIEQLKKGEAVKITPHGNSMKGRVDDGQEVIVVPAVIDDLVVGDVVLCRVKGKEYLHLLTAIDGSRFQISNNQGYVNGWIGKTSIYGKALL